MNRFSSRQLVIAKCAIVGLVALVAGPLMADDSGEIPVAMLVVLALVGASAGMYEVLSRGLAMVLGRSWHDAAASVEPAGAPAAHPASGYSLRRRDVVAALAVYLGAQALVWIIAGVVAAARAGRGGGRGDLLQALAGLVPVALPGSLVAGVIALLLVLRRWRKRLGHGELARLLGLSRVRPLRIVNSVLGGAALAMFILPLMALVANRPEPTDVMTQLVGASSSTLLAWMISAVLLAPPIEELMFRGALLGGLARTWNIRSAALISGTTFWLMHGPEFVHWPAAVAIGLLTILCTWLRVRSGSLGPSIAAHFGYNLVLATVMALAMAAKPEGAKWAQGHQLQRIAWVWGWPGSGCAQGEDRKLRRTAESGRDPGPTDLHLIACSIASSDSKLWRSR